MVGSVGNLGKFIENSPATQKPEWAGGRTILNINDASNTQQTPKSEINNDSRQPVQQSERERRFGNQPIVQKSKEAVPTPLQNGGLKFESNGRATSFAEKMATRRGEQSQQDQIRSFDASTRKINIQADPVERMESNQKLTFEIRSESDNDVSSSSSNSNDVIQMEEFSNESSPTNMSNMNDDSFTKYLDEHRIKPRPNTGITTSLLLNGIDSLI